MVSSINSSKLESDGLNLRRISKAFGKNPNIGEIPNLIYLQKKSYDDFLQFDSAPDQRANKGLEAIFRSTFPISSSDGKATIEYVSYQFGHPKYDVNEAVQRGVNYAAPLMLMLRLVITENKESEGGSHKEVRFVREQDVYMGEVPLMTENGTFVINGAQRVIVSQMHRSPGVFYFHDEGKNNSVGKYLYSARVVPYRGSWLDFEFDTKDLIFFRVDKKRKLCVTTLFRALGYDSDAILREFYTSKTLYRNEKRQWYTRLNIEDFRGVRLINDIVDAESGEVIFAKGIRITQKVVRDFAGQERYYLLSDEDVLGCYLAAPLHDTKGEPCFVSGQEIVPAVLEHICDVLNAKEISILDINPSRGGAYIRNTLFVDKNETKEEALFDIYRVLRPGDTPTLEAAEALLNSLFFDPERYDLSLVGRMKINIKHDLSVGEEETCLRVEDIFAFVKHLIALRNGEGMIDDIDSLSNRRVRSVGELIENQFRLGLVRMERVIVDRMNAAEIEEVMLHDLINSKALASIINEFFGTSQLSQFMDQTNPLSEIAHKRRISALGPGGLTRDRASFAVRDVHYTHYGRICPIETPEGANIGLINSLATYARINKYGLIESPYIRVIDGKVTAEVCYMSAIEEAKYNIAQANSEVGPNGNLVGNMISCRRNGEFFMQLPSEVDFIDISPKQLVSVATSLIPFVENDDANRALMGSNMQRQAVPLLCSERPLVGTGMEGIVARDSGAVVLAKRDGIVDYVDANRIVLRYEGEGQFAVVDMYNLIKYQKSNQNTCINQRPIVKVGDKVKKGDVIADGPCTDLGELALGRNVLVAFMSWGGYNFEDSIVISEKLVCEDKFTSIHIQEYEVIARDTRLGAEEITRYIPNTTEEMLRNLDESGIICVGAEVQGGDILVGKVTPKTESPLTPEEKLLRAVFGEKAAEVHDSSLRVPPGEKGIVIGVRIFTRRGVEKDERALALERMEIERLTRDHDDELEIVNNSIYSKLENMLLNAEVVPNNKIGLEKSTLTSDVLKKLPKQNWMQLELIDENLVERVSKLREFYDKFVAELDAKLQYKVAKLQSGDDLPQGALKMIKVYVATKIKLQSGDKMAGRHGNKGVVSKIVPVEDMPFLDSGETIDMILNPLGVPSRMNIGQILETHLGWASEGLGRQIGDLLKNIEQEKVEVRSEKIKAKLAEIYDSDSSTDQMVREVINNLNSDQLDELANNLKHGIPFDTPVFDGARESDINRMLMKAGLPVSGQIRLRDGRSGEYFDRAVTVGKIYMCKLDHLVDYKMHARSIGPYSLVTQQPLGGKSYFGGQRCGEMEVWAFEAYGAAYTLQELLTVKSDDVAGRIKVYECIVKGDNRFEPGMPESFKVMTREIMSLGLKIEPIKTDEVLESGQEAKHVDIIKE